MNQAPVRRDTTAALLALVQSVFIGIKESWGVCVRVYPWACVLQCMMGMCLCVCACMRVSVHVYVCMHACLCWPGVWHWASCEMNVAYGDPWTGPWDLQLPVMKVFLLKGQSCSGNVSENPTCRSGPSAPPVLPITPPPPCPPNTLTLSSIITAAAHHPSSFCCLLSIHSNH